ncbi:uncharacterized protein LOC134176884 [Corticium candelabrum]|uniref:uncharacterized protein LOC134176884 n=1 Tax=Corticium candelabrum TaxID=121492 RepID=UPI002E26395D|nr:uncharacterized protein LOC134176884 [Corticium candelabrum]
MELGTRDMEVPCLLKPVSLELIEVDQFIWGILTLVSNSSAGNVEEVMIDPNCQWKPVMGNSKQEPDDFGDVELIVKPHTIVRENVKVSPDWMGLLTCFAMYSLGNGSMAVNVTVQTPADPPIVGDVVSSTHSVEYHWTLGDDGHSVIMQVKISCHILYL